MATSRTSYAIGNAERLAGGGRSFVRNEIKRSWSGGRKFFTQDQIDELAAKFLGPICRDWRVPKVIRDQLIRSVWDEFEMDRQLAVMISSREAADRRRKLGLNSGRRVRLGIA